MNNEVENLKTLKNAIIISTIILLILIIIIITMQKNTKKGLPKEIAEIKPNEVIEIQENEYNKYKYEKIPEDRKYMYLLQDYIEQELYEIDSAYECLDTEYKNKRFKDLNDFKEFAENRKKQLRKSYVYEYSTKDCDGYTQYIIKDQYDNYFIFKETNVLEYSILLDSYTVDIPQFTEKYDSTNEKGKCILNIEKIKQALNSGDYKYVYGKLADSFKNNNYKTQEEFENYMKQAIYSNINIEYGDFSNEGSTYIYDIKITDANNAENQIINMQIIMQLKEDRDFVMSFSIK